MFPSHDQGGYGGFCFDSTNEVEQLENNAILFYNMIEVLTRYEIPFTTIAFPKMIEDANYLFDKLEFIEGFTIFNFLEKHRQIANPKKITIK